MEYELYHHGIKGMRWGVRRYQNKNGSLTPAGKKRYSDNAYGRFQKGLYELEKSGRGNDIDAVTKLAAQYDKDRKNEKTLAKNKKRYADALNADTIKKNINAASKTIKKSARKGIIKAKKEIAKMSESEVAGELTKRGKSAVDVLMNGDKDWMGHPLSSDNVTVEIRNRGKAALERLMYSQEQIDNKKFFGSYNPFD